MLVFAPLSQGEPGSFEAHTGSATAISVHPSGDMFASVGADGSYVLYDLQSMDTLTQVRADSSKSIWSRGAGVF